MRASAASQVAIQPRGRCNRWCSICDERDDPHHEPIVSCSAFELLTAAMPAPLKSNDTT